MAWIPAAIMGATSLLSGNKTSQTTQQLMPQQQEAVNALMDYARQGQTPYGGDFNVTPDILQALMGAYKSGEGFAGLEGPLKEGMSSGFNVATDEFAKSQRALADTAINKAVQKVMAEAAGGGSKYSSAAATRAARAGGEVQAQAENEILKQVIAARENAANRRTQLIGVAGQLTQAFQQFGVDIAKLQMAANQFQEGMSYEEFKRMHPDVYQIMLQVFGKDVDSVIQQEPNAFGKLTSFLAPIVSGMAQGGSFDQYFQ